MQGANIEEHFYKIGYQQADPYLKRAHKLANITLPPKPKHWQQTSGWTRYNKDGSFEKVEAPLEDTMVFDVEVLMSEGKYPTIAVAATAEAWYSWTSPFVNGEDKSSEYLVPFGSSQKEESPRIIVGHNVGYDRARIADEYNVKGTNIRYIDTMSLHIAVSGICSQQRPMWSKENKRRIEQQQQQDESQLMAEHLGLADNSKGEAPVDFYDVSTLNSLRDVANFYCAENIDKSQRSYFEKGTLDDVKDHFQSLMSYCAKDVELTHMVYKKVFPQFREYCPHPASFLGMLEIGSAFLTVTEKWEKYLKQATEAHNILEEKLELKLVELADEAMKLTGNDEEIMKDPWLSQLDWTVNPRQRKLKGAPAWYKDIYNTKEQRPKVTLRSRISPILLRTRWKEYPLHFVKDNGWCFEIPESDLINHKPSLVIRNEGRFFVKVPHKDGEDANCGNPFAKGYLKAFDGGILNSDYKEAEDALKLNSQSAYWISARERILSQFVVWDTDKKINLNLPPRDGKNGIILPQMIAMGTITRRAVERTWLTASNAKLNRIGSELKSMITAPEGYKIVGADVDSEELWISSLIGDAQFGFHGATALGWMTLQGTKAHGTDLHSKTAKIVGISRDTAKIFNYARIYGAGVKYATSLLMQHSPGMDLKQAKELGAHLYKETKGTKCFEKGGWYSSPFWTGGSESFMFNSLEHIANSDKPKTPVLGCTITKALQPRYTKTQFLTSRVNWVVQSSGVDYLHLLIVSMSHLIEKYKIDARFMISVHDEVRYMSTKEDEHRTALALQVANLWTRSLFCQRLGIESLPQVIK